MVVVVICVAALVVEKLFLWSVRQQREEKRKNKPLSSVSVGIQDDGGSSSSSIGLNKELVVCAHCMRMRRAWITKHKMPGDTFAPIL